MKLVYDIEPCFTWLQLEIKRVEGLMDDPSQSSRSIDDLISESATLQRCLYTLMDFYSDGMLRVNLK